jgi:Flp pilus assembly protein TadG
MASMRRTRSGSGLWPSRDGISTVEFALCSGILLTLCVGMIDFGIGLWQWMQVQSAAQAGAQYAMLNPGAPNSSISSAVTGATTLSGIAVTSGYPQTTCGCPTGSASAPTGLTTGVSCGSTCSAGGTAQQYILVKAQVGYSMIVSWPGVSNPLTLTATSYALY